MRRLLLKWANKIYNKYGFMEIRINNKFIYKNDIFIVDKISLKQIKEGNSSEELTVKLLKKQTLGSYLMDKIKK